jgi:hypothetical protein
MQDFYNENCPVGDTDFSTCKEHPHGTRCASMCQTSIMETFSRKAGNLSCHRIYINMQDVYHSKTPVAKQRHQEAKLLPG